MIKQVFRFPSNYHMYHKEPILLIFFYLHEFFHFSIIPSFAFELAAVNPIVNNMVMGRRAAALIN